MKYVQVYCCNVTKYEKVQLNTVLDLYLMYLINEPQLFFMRAAFSVFLSCLLFFLFVLVEVFPISLAAHQALLSLSARLQLSLQLTSWSGCVCQLRRLPPCTLSSFSFLFLYVGMQQVCHFYNSSTWARFQRTPDLHGWLAVVSLKVHSERWSFCTWCVGVPFSENELSERVQTSCHTG